jgi:putative transposase
MTLDNDLLWIRSFITSRDKRSEEYGFLKECPSQVLQQKLKDLERAFRDCFDKNQPMKRLPVFKKRGLNDGIRFPQGFKVYGNQMIM